MYEYAAALVRAIDGDTYVFDIDLGFCVTTRQHVRLLGLDCPEIATPAGRGALLAARTWFEAHGNQVVLATGRVPAKTFDRWVAQVTGNGDDLATHLRALGHVKPVERLG